MACQLVCTDIVVCSVYNTCRYPCLLIAFSWPHVPQVFLSFKMLLTDGATSQTYDVEGCLAYVFNIQGFMTHIIIYRNGTPKEMSDRFIRGVTATGSWWHPW